MGNVAGRVDWTDDRKAGPGDRPKRHRPGERGAIVRRNGQELELVELLWGLRPRNAKDALVLNIRSEGRVFASRRCLIPATAFVLRDRSPERARWKFTLADGDSFYFAGIWRPASGDWPEAYAVLTTAANPDVAPVHDRQMAVVLRRARLDWLDGIASQEAVLQPLPAGTFRYQRLR